LTSEPDQYQFTGGPFDFKVDRSGDVVSLVVIGDRGDIITQIDFNANRIGRVIDALRESSV
jgi:hypothetical protein